MVVNYKNLKLDQKRGIPTFIALMPFMLKVISNGENWYFKDLEVAVLRKINIPQRLMKYITKNGQPIPFNRADWALSYLHKIHLIARVEVGHYIISGAGLSFLRDYPNYNDLCRIIKNKTRHYQRMMRVERTQKDKSINSGIKNEKQTAESFSDNIYSQFYEHDKKLKEILLHKIHSNQSYFFERVVLILLEKMGYGKSFRTQKSRDGGIDGYIRMDPLGTNIVYMQAKRYKRDNEVGVHAIRDFKGALDVHHASKGVFITTSRYSADAKDYAHQAGIVLIDGQWLASLMLKYHVGIQVQHTYHVLNIDDDFFE